MRKFIFTLILMMPCIATFGQFRLEVKAEVPVDSIFFSDITQQHEYQFIPYATTIDITLKGPLNDLYNLTFYGKDKRMNQLWLNGEHVIIRGTFTGKKLEVDTVIGSGLYYTSLDFRNSYKKLEEQKADSTTLNTFLLQKLKENLNNPFSIEIANTFFRRNLNRKQELRKILPLLAGQDTGIREHLLNPYRKIDNILTRTKIELTKFKFYTPDGKLEPLALSKERRYLIDMWFVGCAPCIEQHKEMAGMSAALKSNNIEIIGISIDQNENQWKNFLAEKKYPWKNVREVDETQKKLRTDMLIESYPTYFLIDSEGNILYRSNSFHEMTSFLKL